METAYSALHNKILELEHELSCVSLSRDEWEYQCKTLHDVAGSYSHEINILHNKVKTLLDTAKECDRYRSALERIVKRDDNCYATTTAKEALEI